MLYLPTVFGDLLIDSIIATGALTGAISEADLRKIRLLNPQTILNQRPPPDFEILAANVHLELPSATIELQFEVGDILFKERSIVKTNLTSPIAGLLFPQTNSTILGMRQGELSFQSLSMHSSMQKTRNLTLANLCSVH